MNSFGSNNLRRMRTAVRNALAAGGAEELEEEADAIMEHIARMGFLAEEPMSALLSSLAAGVSPYLLTGKYRIRGTDHVIRVAPGVMPPGGDTSHVTDILREFVRSSSPRLLADIGCGTGVLGISGLIADQGCLAVLVDSDFTACRAAHSNLRYLGLLSRAHVVCATGLESLRSNVLDLLVANLPFVPTALVSSLPARFGRYVPSHAVDGGPDGLAHIRHLLSQICRVVRPGGRLILQIGTGQKGAVANMLGSSWLQDPASTIQHDTLVVAHRVGNQFS